MSGPNQSASRIIGPPSGSAWSEESTQSQLACLLASESVHPSLVSVPVLHSGLYLCFFFLLLLAKIKLPEVHRFSSLASMRSDIQLIYFGSICVRTVVVSTFAIILSLIVLAFPSSVFVCSFLFYRWFLFIFYNLTINR